MHSRTLIVKICFPVYLRRLSNSCDLRLCEYFPCTREEHHHSEKTHRSVALLLSKGTIHNIVTPSSQTKTAARKCVYWTQEFPPPTRERNCEQSQGTVPLLRRAPLATRSDRAETCGARRHRCGARHKLKRVEREFTHQVDRLVAVAVLAGLLDARAEVA